MEHIRSASRVWLAAMLAGLLLAGCASGTAVQIVGAVVSTAMESAGLKQKTGPDGKGPAYEVPLLLAAGEQLNATSDGQALSLVVRIYQLRDPQSFKSLTYEQAAAPDGGKSVLGEDMITFKEVLVVPGETYQLKQKLPGDGTTLGVVGLFRAPAGNRWKIAFAAKESKDSGITVGAHACALSAGKGALDPIVSTDLARTLSGVQCNG
ncbi:MAG: type VI secretion system lipoprotein TssJ [Pseudomonadota bacterium]